MHVAKVTGDQVGEYLPLSIRCHLVARGEALKDQVNVLRIVALPYQVLVRRDVIYPSN